MKRVYKLFLIFLACLVLTGCKAEYTLTYKNNTFSEEVIISDIEESENNKFSRYYQDSPDLKYDDNNYYNFYEDNLKKRIYYDIGKNLTKTKLISYCFEDLYIIDKKDYLDIESAGENYCKDYNIVIKFKTDKYVFDHNATSSSNGEYIWENTDNGIKLLISKKKTLTDQIKEENKQNNTSSTFKIILGIIVIVIFIISLIYNKKLKKQKAED